MSVAVTRTVDGTNVTYNIAITAEQSLIDLLASEASEYIYNTTQWIRDVYANAEWSALTNTQKMHVLGLYTQRHLRGIGYRAYYHEQQDAIADIETHYGTE